MGKRPEAMKSLKGCFWSVASGLVQNQLISGAPSEMEPSSGDASDRPGASGRCAPKYRRGYKPDCAKGRCCGGELTELRVYDNRLVIDQTATIAR
jgi:hypothetical protein